MDEARDDRVERMLQQLADLDEAPEAELPSDDELRAFREDRLDAERRATLEALLARDAAARARLARLAGAEPVEVPSPELRRRALAGFAGGTPRPTRILWQPLAIAAALALALAAVFFRAPSLPPEASYSVSLRGAVASRSPSKLSSKARAYPDTLVGIEVEPVDVAHDDVSFGLYREEPGTQWVEVTEAVAEPVG